MRSSRCSLVRASLFCASLATVPAASTAADPAAPALHRVKAVPFRVEARIEGTFESPVMAEVRLDAKRIGQLSIEKAVPHGTRVGKGDMLVEVDTERLDEEIADLRIGTRLAGIAQGLMERELAILEKSVPRQLTLARRARTIVTEDLKLYEEREAKLAEELNAVFLKFRRFMRENAEEELAQLEKMYKQDDLTEETEEIVLKRARFQAEISRFFEKLAHSEHDRTAALDLPRQLEGLRHAADGAALDLERAEATLPVAIERMRLDVQRSANQLRKSREHLAELEAGRRLLPITAPIDGTVYYGRFHNGRWVDADNAAQQLRPGGQFDTRQPLLTVVGPGRLTVRAGVPEKDLSRVPAAAEARIVPKAFPEASYAARVRSVSAVPVSAGRFEAMLDLLEDQPRIVAGMEADVRVTADQRTDVLAVPRKAVFTDEFDGGRRFVLVFAGAGKEPLKRIVGVGRSTDELTEITAGLSVGEEILLEKPPAPKLEAPASKTETPAAKADAASKPEAGKPEPAKPEAATQEPAKPAAASPPAAAETAAPPAPAQK